MSTETKPVPAKPQLALRYSDKASEQIKAERTEDKKHEETEQAEREQQRAEKRAARLAARDQERARRERAAESDQKLSDALDALEHMQESINRSKREREQAEGKAVGCRREIERLRAELMVAQGELAQLEEFLAAPPRADLAAAAANAAMAWDEHVAAWNELPKGYTKKNRDRTVRKRAKLAGIPRP